jgi:hypothetical protein
MILTIQNRNSCINQDQHLMTSWLKILWWSTKKQFSHFHWNMKEIRYNNNTFIASKKILKRMHIHVYNIKQVSINPLLKMISEVVSWDGMHLMPGYCTPSRSGGSWWTEVRVYLPRAVLMGERPYDLRFSTIVPFILYFKRAKTKSRTGNLHWQAIGKERRGLSSQWVGQSTQSQSTDKCTMPVLFP